MKVIEARNVNSAWYQAKHFLIREHVKRPSRNGLVFEMPDPVTTVYRNPTERVLFDARRDCNHFFHFFEAMWTLAGRNDIAFLEQFNPKVRDYSDDGKTWRGAYGYRWRQHFDMLGGGPEEDIDQLKKVIRMLKANHEDRRAVLTMWDPIYDLDQPTCRDLPCNLLVLPYIRPHMDKIDRLDITVVCRSNDIIWGAYGSNQVVFSMLLEYLAGMMNLHVGTYRQVSHSFHAYSEVWEKYTGIPMVSGAVPDPRPLDPYTNVVQPYPLIKVPEVWDEELGRWLVDTEHPRLDSEPYRNPFFPQVATPIMNAWLYWKRDQSNYALEALEHCAAEDWKLACTEWLERRIKARSEKRVGVV